MTKKQRRNQKPTKRNRRKVGYRARCGDWILQSWTVGPVPIVNRLMQRMRLEEILLLHLPPDDPRVEVPTVRCLLLLVRNVLVSREPIYGLGEWAECYAPDLLGLTQRQLGQLNDDRVGRSLDRLFDGDTSQFLIDVVRQMVSEFDLKLDELHNDSTSISFFGQYEDAAQEDKRRGKPTAAVTYGHSKDHRPDLKQLLYILTVTDDGGVPVYFTTASGNVTDDTTHQETWKLLTQLTGRKDFLYVADCKLASSENLQYIVNHGGRFITLLPRTRKESTEFRQRLIDGPDKVAWEHVKDVLGKDGKIIDRVKVCGEPQESKEGYRLHWYHSCRKQERDAASRQKSIERALKELRELEQRLKSSRTRFRQRPKVEDAVSDILRVTRSGAWVQVVTEAVEEELYKQAKPGRPNKKTQYVREVRERYQLSITVDQSQVATDQASDGVFPLITSEQDMSAADVLAAYKRQPIIEKRFSQFKTDFAVAPVYLKEISRIHSLLCIYFLALCVQTLLERELRRAMVAAEQESLPLYPEGRACRAPTARRVLDVFESIQRHEVQQAGETLETYVTELRPLHRQLLKLLGVTIRSYGQ
jgi:transposase